jgi:hypothetical protein
VCLRSDFTLYGEPLSSASPNLRVLTKGDHDAPDSRSRPFSISIGTTNRSRLGENAPIALPQADGVADLPRYRFLLGSRTGNKNNQKNGTIYSSIYDNCMLL